MATREIQWSGLRVSGEKQGPKKARGEVGEGRENEEAYQNAIRLDTA